MARGFVSGIVWGTVLSVGVAGVASVLAPPPFEPEVSDTAPGEAEAPARVTEADNGERAGAEDAPVPNQQAPQAPAPQPDDLEAVDAVTTRSVAPPETGGAEGLQAPAEGASDSAVTLEGDAPVFPNPQALAPMEPLPADQLSITTEPAQPPAPEVDGPGGAFETALAPGAQQVETETPEAQQVETETPEAQQAEQNSEAPEAQNSAAAPEVGDSVIAPPVPPLAEEPDIATAQTVPDPEPGPAVTPVAPPPAVRDLPTAPDEEPEQSATLDRPGIGTPAAVLAERDTGVKINRLPTASAVPGDPVDGPAAEIGVAARAIDRYARPFENPDDKPLMSIILIDSGSDLTGGEIGIAALRSFPYPLTFAVDVSLPDATERMEIYRSEGFEVLAMVDLPELAAPSDAEVSLADATSRVPEVVGVLEGTGAGFQQNRELSDQVTAILSEGGYGIVTQDQGLNTMAKLAVKEGVPAAPVFRDFDSAGQTPTVIRRFLDQAAFKAGQEGAVIMLGRMRPDTISALLLWGLQDRASQVALAPVSAVLLGQE